jgi:hypothetical protein
MVWYHSNTHTVGRILLSVDNGNSKNTALPRPLHGIDKKISISFGRTQSRNFLIVGGIIPANGGKNK